MKQMLASSNGQLSLFDLLEIKAHEERAARSALAMAGPSDKLELTTTMHFVNSSMPALQRRRVLVEEIPIEEIPRRPVISPALWAVMNATVEPVGDLLSVPTEVELAKPSARLKYLDLARVLLPTARYEDVAQAIADMVVERREAKLGGLPFSYWPMVGSLVRSGLGVLLDLGKFGVALWNVVQTIRKFFS